MGRVYHQCGNGERPLTWTKKTSANDIRIMYTDFQGASNAAYHRIMFKHMEAMGMPLAYAQACGTMYVFASTRHVSHHGAMKQILVDRGTTLHVDIVSLLKWAPSIGYCAAHSWTPWGRSEGCLVSQCNTRKSHRIELSFHQSQGCPANHHQLQ